MYQQDFDQPQEYIWGDANMTYHFRVPYEINGHFYRFVGIQNNPFGQRLPLLQLQPGGEFGGPQHTPGYAPQYPGQPSPQQFPAPPQQFPMPPQQFQVPPQQFQFPTQEFPPQPQQFYGYGYPPQPQMAFEQPPFVDTSVPTWRIPTVGIVPPTPDIAAAIAARQQPLPFTGQPTYYQEFVPQQQYQTEEPPPTWRIPTVGIVPPPPDVARAIAAREAPPRIAPRASAEQTEEETHSVATYDPTHDRNLSFTVKHNWNTQTSEIKDVILIEDDKLPQTRQERSSTYLAQLIVDCGLQNEMLEFKRQQPLAFICEIRHPSEPSSSDRFAVVYDYTPLGYMFASRRLQEDHNLGQKVLCVKQNGEANPQTSFDFTGRGQGIDVRVFIVGRNGWLIYFAPDRPWILTADQYLVFTSSQTQIAFKNIFDAKREDGRESFFKQYMLSGTAPLDGMVIYQAVIQRDTPKDGTFAVIGNGNSVLAMTQIQNMLTETQSPKHYFDKPNLMAPAQQRRQSGVQLSTQRGPRSFAASSTLPAPK